MWSGKLITERQPRGSNQGPLEQLYRSFGSRAMPIDCRRGWLQDRGNVLLQSAEMSLPRHNVHTYLNALVQAGRHSPEWGKTNGMGYGSSNPVQTMSSIYFARLSPVVVCPEVHHV